jgi:hypothetical protein
LGTKEPAVILDKMLEVLEEWRMEHLERDMFGYDDDVGYYDYDDWSTNAANGAFCPEALEVWIKHMAIIKSCLQIQSYVAFSAS